MRELAMIMAAFACYAAFAAPDPGKEYFGRIKDPVQIVTNGYTKAEVDSKVTDAKAVAVAHADEATNAIRRVDGAARMLPPYLHAIEFADSYPDDAAWYYARPQDYGHCSALRSGNTFSRNYDWKFDEAAEFVVSMAAGPGRFASVGVANCGTNLTERFVTGGAWSRFYKCLPGRTVDGINENGVVCCVNVIGGDPQTSGWNTDGTLHPLAAVRWVLDNATNAQHAVVYLLENICFPHGWTQNFHWMIADATGTYIVENGESTRIPLPNGKVAMTNFRRYPYRDTAGEGQERYDSLMAGASITSQWWTATYTRAGYRPSDLPGIDSNTVFSAWANGSRESHRGETFGGQTWWQTVHTSVYDITNRVLRIAVQEKDDWYAFAVPNAGGLKAESDPTVPAWAKADEKPTYSAAEVGAIGEGMNRSKSFSLGPRLGMLGGTTMNFSSTGISITGSAFGGGDFDFSVWNWIRAGDCGMGDFLEEQIGNAGKVKTVAGKQPDDATGNVQLSPSDIGAYPAASGQLVEQSVQIMSLHMNAEDAKVIVTNYDSQTHMPSMSLHYKTEQGEWREVWNEKTRWDWLTGTYLPANFYTKAEVDARTDHVPWGLFDSQTGNYSPDGTVQISADRTIICKGASYQRTVTAQGNYFVWTANEPYEISGVESNGYFRIEDADGNVTFEVVKGDKVTAHANANETRTESVMGITHIHIHYPIEADAHPTLEVCNDLRAHAWKKEDEADCLANVSWTGTSGDYWAEVWGKTAQDSLFVRGTYMRGSDPYVRYAAALAVQQLKIGNVIYNVGTATISGHTVLTLTPAN